MPTITCQHTGVEFEARSKTAKNHPEVSRILGELDRLAYGPMMDALAALKAAGRKPSLEEFAELAEAAKAAGRERRAVNVAAWRERREERRAACNALAYGRSGEPPDNISNAEMAREVLDRPGDGLSEMPGERG